MGSWVLERLGFPGPGVAWVPGSWSQGCSRKEAGYTADGQEEKKRSPGLSAVIWEPGPGQGKESLCGISDILSDFVIFLPPIFKSVH